jgi:protein SCO1
MPLRARLAIFLAATFAVLAAAIATLAGGEATPPKAGYEGALRPPGIPPAEFRMRDQDDRVATLREYRGDVVVVTFLYTTCEDTCPLVGQQVRGALDRLGRDVPVLAVAVDPPRDTPASARRFLAEQKLAGRMRFLLGPDAQLRRQWKAYGIRPQGDGFEHTAHVVLLDRRGVQRIGFPVAKLTPEALAHDVALLERGDDR